MNDRLSLRMCFWSDILQEYRNRCAQRQKAAWPKPICIDAGLNRYLVHKEVERWEILQLGGVAFWYTGIPLCEQCVTRQRLLKRSGI